MIENLYQTLLPSIAQFHSLGYWIAFLVAFAETALVAGLLIPGSTLLLLLGALTATGQLEFAGVFWFGVAGAVLGDNLNYWLGKRYGRRWVKTGLWFLKSEHFEKAHDFFNQNGAKSVFLGRFIPSIKEIAPFVAGSVGMRPRVFLFWNVLGGIGWGLQWIGGGYLFGQSLALAQAWMSRAGLVFLAVLLAWLLLWYVKRILIRQGPQIWLLLVSLSRSVRSALAANPYLKQYHRRHPHTVAFVAARLDRSRFNGLPLTLLALTLGYVAILFGGIVEDFLTTDPIVAVDQAVAQLVARFRPHELIPIFTWITALGIAKVVAPLLLLAVGGVWFTRGRWAATSLVVSVGGTALFNSLGKLAFHRPRPVEAILLENSYSFPSGHAAIAIAFYGFLGYLLIRSAHQWKTRVNLLLLSIVIALLIGLSRIVLGVHYLSDVWAGYLIGAGWAIIGIAVSEWATLNHRIDWYSPVSPHLRRAAWGITSIGMLWYLGYTAAWHPRLFTPPPVTPIPIEQPLVDFIRQKQLTHAETILGEPSQPLSVAFVASNEAALVHLLRQAGWQPADPPTPTNLLRLWNQGMTYARTPLAPVFWNGRINDLGFEREMEVDSEKVIDTVRLWKTDWLWGGSPVFVGVVRSYTGMYWRILHQVAPDTDAATERLMRSIAEQDPKPITCMAKLGKAKVGTYLLRMPFFSSGKIGLVDLRDPTTVPLCSTHK
jgi:membrane protein DedA with SNARE-associated domain/membrane-associated phospholipid phosphatase